MCRSCGRRRWFRLALEPIEALEPRAFWIERWLFGAAATLKGAIRRSIGARIRGEAHPEGAGSERPKLP